MDALCWIFTPLPADESAAIAVACDEIARDCVEEGLDEAWAELYDRETPDDLARVIHGGWKLPFAEDLRRSGRYYGTELPKGVRERLATCQTGIEIRLPHGRNLSPLGMTLVAFLLERVGKGAIDWGDHRPELSEDARAELGGPREASRPPRRPSGASRAESEPPARANEAADEARDLLTCLVKVEQIELSPQSKIDDLARRLAAILEEDPGEGRAGRVYDWLLRDEDIDEVFLTEDELARVLSEW